MSGWSSSSSTSPKRKPVIGIVGGIGAGKSSVARLFAAQGCGVIDADELAHRVLREPEVRDTLVSWWGREILDAQGQVNRKAVGQKVFNNAAELSRLEAIIHPRIGQMREIERARMQRDPAIVAIIEDSPLLLEKGLDRLCDVIVFVQTDRAIRLARLAQSRGWSEAEVARREKNQLSLDSKAQRADYVVDNDLNESEVSKQIHRILSQLTTQAR